MGTWGHGNLDSDYAWDDLSGRQSELMKSLLLRAQRKASREADEWDYTALFVDLEMLFAMETAGLLRKIAMPAPAAIQALAADYLAAWQPYYEELGGSDEHVAKRRAVIEQSFERLAKICAEFEGTGPLPSAEPPKPVAAAAPKKSSPKKSSPKKSKKPAKKSSTKKRR